MIYPSALLLLPAKETHREKKTSLIRERSQNDEMTLRSLPRSLFLLLLLFFVSTSTIFSVASAGKNFTWSLCSPEPPFQSGVFNVTLAPPQPVAGQTAVLSIDASTDAVPAAGTSEGFGFAAVSVSFHGLTIYSLSRPLCSVAESTGSCPFTGPYSLKWELEFPATAPPGRYRLRLRAQESEPGGREKEPPSSSRGYGAAGPEILCVDIAFHIAHASPSKR